MSKITNPHDAVFKQFLGKPEIAVDFLNQHLPTELLAALDLSTLTEQKDSFVDPALRQHFSDLLYQVQTGQKQPILLYLLFEHKSYPDRDVGFQLLRYKVRIWEKAQAQKTPRLPIFPLVVYHGREAWTVPRTFTSALDWGEEEPEIATWLRSYLPEFSYHLVDLSALSDAEIKGGIWLRAFELVLKHIFDPDLGKRLDDILGLVVDLATQPTGLEMLVTLLRYVIRAGSGANKEEIQQTVLNLFPKQGSVLMKTAAEEWMQEGEAIGLRKGEAIGLQKGEAIGAQKTLRQSIAQILQHRFAPSDEIVAELTEQLEKIVDGDTLHNLVNASLQVFDLAEFRQRLEKRPSSDA